MLKLGECIFERGLCVYLEPVCPLIFSLDNSETGSFPIKTRGIWDPGTEYTYIYIYIYIHMKFALCFLSNYVIDHHEVEFPMNETV